MKKIVIAALISLASQIGYAEGIYVAGGYDFIDGASDWALGYKTDILAVEVRMLEMGKEEPTTKPGPENSLNVLVYIPTTPVFVKLALVHGEHGKDGYNYGAGVDYPITDNWLIRGQITYCRVTEDINEGAETEHQVSVGIKYQF